MTKYRVYFADRTFFEVFTEDALKVVLEEHRCDGYMQVWTEVVGSDQWLVDEFPFSVVESIH